VRDGVAHELTVVSRWFGPTAEPAEAHLESDLRWGLQLGREHEPSGSHHLGIVEATLQWREPARMHDHVVVDERHHVSGRHAHRVARSAPAPLRCSAVRPPRPSTRAAHNGYRATAAQPTVK